ncbi:MAG: hypothetical protein GY791_06720 [Alphaproteobacteria bacterium]|nr:hypothetical protein [Alphaproteobacteria bacterium]
MVDEIEAVERAAVEDLGAAASEELRAALKIESGALGSAHCLIAGGLPASAIVINRTIGLGLTKPADRDLVADMVARYRAAGAARYFVHVHHQAQPDELPGWLGEFGLKPTRGWAKFRRGREAPPAVETTLDIRPATADAFGRIEADAFDVGSAGAPWLARLVGRPNWHIFMSFAGDEPAGAGALFVHDGIGWCDWGATAPDFRGRGGQSAVLRARIVAALDLGCRMLVTETGEEVPGDPQHSYKNIVKMGFEEAYVRANYALPKSV